MAKQTKRPKPEAGVSREVYLAKFQDYSNTNAQKLDYPNLEVFHLAHRFSYIAREWSKTKAQEFVREYGETLYTMLLKGYNIILLPVENQLPEELMTEMPQASVLAAIRQAYSDLS
jgi:hypothetical protein